MILIAIPNYIVRKGIESLMKEFCMAEKIMTVGSSEELDKFLETQNAKLIYIHTSLLPLAEKWMNRKDDCKWIRVIQEKPEALKAESFQSDILYLDDEETHIIKNIKRNIALTEKSPQSESEESELSEREKDILREIALGKTNKEIADILFISAHTVITHRKNITRKLGIKTVSGLTIYAILNKLIQMEEI
jgi:DNA-binding CsgD family transcriptional regulator